MVSICCITYNQEKYIGDSLKGFLMQKTNFKYEILLHEDASTDGTADVIREYQEKYPNRIDCIFQTENQFHRQNPFIDVLFRKAKGKYIAMCEGDDYWIDPLKLQKQIDILESDESYMITGHAVETLNDDGNKDILKAKDGDFTFRDLMLGMNIPTLSLVIRNIKGCFEKEIGNYPAGDFYIKSYLLNLGKGYLFKEPMGVYRVHNHGFWSSQAKNVIHKKTIIGYRKFLASFPKRKKDIRYGTVKYKLKNKLFFTDISKYVFSDILVLFQIGFKKIFHRS